MEKHCSLEQLQGVDWQASLDNAGGSEEVARELLTLFIDSYPAEYLAINQAFQQEDIKVFREHIHRLHGTLCYIAIPRLKVIVAKLDELGQRYLNHPNNQLLEQIKAHFIEFNQQAAPILAQIENKT